MNAPAVQHPDTPAPSATQSTVFQWPVRVYWEDTDAGGVVFYANYLKFFERARTEWLRALGLGQQQLRETVGGLFVVTDAQIKYHRPARLDDMLCVTARLREAGRATLHLEQSAYLQSPDVAQPGVLLCEGSVRIGWVDATHLRPARLPQTVLRVLATPPRTP